jgi:hydroxymethylglutaryl-CoA lyase
MAFGNPYGDAWNENIAMDWCRKLNALGINHLALADTTGSSTPETITSMFSALIPELKNVELGAHLHSTKEKSAEKIKAAYDSGCRNFDVAVHGFGGCPMAADDLTGNIATEELERFVLDNKLSWNLNEKELFKSYEASWKIFNTFH